MQVSVLRHILTIPTLIAVAVAVLLLSSADTTRASFGTPEFSPTYDVRTCNVLPPLFVDASLAGTGPTCTQNTTSNVPTDYGVVYDIPVGHHNFGGVFVNLTTELVWADDLDIVDGTKVGGLRSTTTLGLTNNVCGAAGSLFPEFVFFDAKTTGALLATQPEGTSDRFSTVVTDDLGEIPFLPGIADANSPMVDNNLDFIDALFNGAQAKFRYASASQVPAGGDWIILQIVGFDPDVLRAAFNNANDRTNPLARMNKPTTESTVIFTVLQDPGAVKPSVSVISDFCSPLGTVLGIVGTVTNPVASGNHHNGYITQSQRDADNDGFENSFDTCPFDTNIEDQFPLSFDKGPDVGGGDNFDSACDPSPTADSSVAGDHDADGFANAQDLCPAFPNGPDAGPNTSSDSESSTASVVAAPDGGPGSDSIGDDCDTQSTIANGGFFQVHYVDSNCVGTDSDGDGWCDGTAAAVIAASGTSSVRIVASSNNSSPQQTGQVINSTADTDGDGVANGTEVIIGTDPTRDCSLIKGHDAWPADFDMNRVINTTDVFQVLPPVLGSSVGGSAFSVRADLSPNGVINTTDVFQVLPPILGSSCTV